MKLSDNFYLHEFQRSMTATRLEIDNTIPEEIIPKLRNLCHRSLQPLRNAYGKYINVVSGYRCSSLNSFIGGSTSSQHPLGEAGDVDTVEDNYVLFRIMTEENIPFDQLIWEFGDEKPEWLHISWRPEPRMEILRAYKHKGRTQYEPFK